MKIYNPSAAEIALFIFRPYFLKDNFWYIVLWGFLLHGFAGICIFNILWWENPANLDDRLACTILNVVWGFVNSVILMAYLVPFIYHNLLNRSRLKLFDHFIVNIILFFVEITRFYITNSHIYNFGISYMESFNYIASFSSVIMVFNFLLILTYKTDDEVRFVSKNPAKIEIGRGSKDVLTLSEDRLLVVAAAGNYSEVYWLNNIDVIQKSLFPLTLGSIEIELMALPQFYHCHKSFIINLSQIEKYYGNTRESYVEMQHHGAKIPVARDKIRKLKAMLANANTDPAALDFV